MTVLVWVMAATAMWHFAVLAPDRFYGGIIGSLAAANGAAIALGIAASGFAVPAATSLADALLGLAGGSAGLLASWLVGSRYDPVHVDESRLSEARRPTAHPHVPPVRSRVTRAER